MKNQYTMKITELQKLIREEVRKIVNESTINGFRPILDRTNQIDERIFKKLLPKTEKTSKEAMKRILTFEGNTMFTHSQYHIVKPNGNGGNLNKDVKLKFDLTAYPRTHHLPNQPKKIVIARGENIKVIEHPFKKQPNDSLIMYKNQEWVVVKSSLDIAIDRPTYRFHDIQYWLNDAQMKMQGRDPKESVNVTLVTVYDITDPMKEQNLGKIYVDTDSYLDELKRVFELIKRVS